MCLCSVYPQKSRELVGEERKERGEERKTAEIIAGLLFLGVSAEMAALHPAAGGRGGGVASCALPGGQGGPMLHATARQNPSQGAV